MDDANSIWMRRGPLDSVTGRRVTFGTCANIARLKTAALSGRTDYQTVLKMAG